MNIGSITVVYLFYVFQNQLAMKEESKYQDKLIYRTKMNENSETLHSKRMNRFLSCRSNLIRDSQFELDLSSSVETIL